MGSCENAIRSHEHTGASVPEAANIGKVIGPREFAVSNCEGLATPPDR